MLCWRCGTQLPRQAIHCMVCRAQVHPLARRRSSNTWAILGIAFLLFLLIAFLLTLLAAKTFHGLDQEDGTSDTGGDTSTESTVSSDPEADFDAIFARVSPAVVKINAVTCTDAGVGSGFMIDSDTVVTAAHVVDEAVAVEIQSGEHTEVASVERIDTDVDLAVLELAEPLMGVTLDFAGHDAEVGEEVAAVGHPRGSETPSISEGAIDAIVPDAPVEETTLYDLVASTATTSPGNSGGPLIDADGDVAGVVVAGEKTEPQRSFAIQTSEVESRVTDPAAMTRPSQTQCDTAALGPDDGG